MRIPLPTVRSLLSQNPRSRFCHLTWSFRCKCRLPHQHGDRPPTALRPNCTHKIVLQKSLCRRSIGRCYPPRAFKSMLVPGYHDGQMSFCPVPSLHLAAVFRKHSTQRLGWGHIGPWLGKSDAHGSWWRREAGRLTVHPGR